jgi:diguanylate cyclase (GGDEF)-like protein/PAS domain S-box-containing protein
MPDHATRVDVPIGRGDLALAALAALPGVGVVVFDHALRRLLTAGEPFAGHGDEARWAPGFRAALRGERASWEYKPDAAHWHRVEVVPVAHAGEIIGGLALSRDITERKAEQAARTVADAQFRTAFDDAAIGMALVAPDGAWLRVNPALCAILGYTREQLQAKTFQDITHPEDLDADLALVHQVLAGERSSYQLEKRYFRGDGSTVWALLSVSLVRDADGAPLHFVSQVQDISERKRLETELHRLATLDDLTGLFNRREFAHELARHLALARRHHVDAAVLMLDLDGLKTVNDTLGHHGGDMLLRHVADVLRSRLRASDVIARLGGDEFAVLLTQTGADEAAGIRDDLYRELGARPARVEGCDIAVTASIGLAVLDATLDPESILGRADQAMYQAKRARRAPR